MSIDEKFRRLNDGENWSGLELQPRRIEPRRRRAPLLLQVAVIGVVGIAVGVAVTLGVSGIRNQSGRLQPADPTSPPTAVASPTPTITPRAGEPGDFLSGDEVIAAWLYDIENFPGELPAGFAFPRLPQNGVPRDNEGYQTGVTTGMVADNYRCAWEFTYLTALDADDASDAQAALATIDAYADLQLVADYFPDFDVWYDLTIVPAKLGDLTALANDVNNSCGTKLNDMRAAATEE